MTHIDEQNEAAIRQRPTTPLATDQRDAGARTAGPPVAVVIPNWNSLAYLERCLASVEAQRGVEVEILVVDNGSEDGSSAWLESRKIPHLSLSANAGFAAAINLGVERTAAEHVMILNADAILAPDCLALLGDALGRDPALGGVQPRIMACAPNGEIDHRAVYSIGQNLTHDGRAYECGAGERLTARHLQRREIFGVCGAACLMRRQLLTDLGGYEESYFAFCEDVELNIRARARGWRFEIIPDAVAWHVGNAIWRSGFHRPAAVNARLVARNRLTTQLEFMPPSAAPRIALVEAGSLFRAARERRLRATLAGKLSALASLHRTRQRRRLLRRTGDLNRPRAWLGRS